MTDESATDRVRDEMMLMGNHYAVRLRPVMDDHAGKVSLIKLTATGTAVIQAIRRPTNIGYIRGF